MRAGQKHTWSLNDFSKGLGPLEYEPGYYYWAFAADARQEKIVTSGPGVNVDLTGIASNEKVVKAIQIGSDYWVATSTTVYYSSAGTANWSEKGANGVGWTVGNPTDIVAFSASGGNPIIGVAMGSSTAFQYTVDNGANWIVSTRASDASAKYAN